MSACGEMEGHPLVFSSILFLFKFLPVALIVYYLTPQKGRNLVLVVLSLFFYGWGEPKYIFIMLASVAVDYLASLGIEHHRGKIGWCRFFLTISLVFNLGMLFFFKYTNFFIENINLLTGTSWESLALTLPLGISFYTFQTLSYTIDVYFNRVKAETNLIDFAAFVSLFPQLIAGPIVKYTDINHELKQRTINAEDFYHGVRLFIMGLGSKVLIANNVGSLWDEVQLIGFTNISTPLAWLGIIACTLQIYFDFSGYSLMAIGLGRMLGFKFPQNFNYPYIAQSVTEFWHRWHMTLSSWFKEYVYIPLGGSRKGRVRTYFNLFVVWFCTGFWHGASWNFIFWGLFFLVLLVIEKMFLLKYLNKWKFFSHLYLLLAVVMSWVIFSITDLTQMGLYFKSLFVFQGGTDYLYYLRNYTISLVCGVFFCTPLLKNWYQKHCHQQLLVTLGLSCILILSIAYLVDSSYNPFLYFRF